MRYIPPTFGTLADMATIDVARLTEDQARTMLEKIRWPNGPICPHCNERDITRLSDSGKFRDGLIQCNRCRGQFTVTVGTVMHGSHITLRQWVQTFHSMCSHKKGVSALQLQRNLGLKSYRSAWHLAHRIRLAMREDPIASMLKGTVEADETYIGGRSRGGKRGRGAAKKAIVFALIERDGRARSKPVERVNAETLKSAIRQNVDKIARVMTDEFSSYRGIGREFEGGHKVVNHGDGQYARGKDFYIHVNNAESYFALLKRGVHGTFHHVSKKHLGRYCDEFSFRWSQRKVTDGERAAKAIRQAEGKRLIFKDSKSAVVFDS